MQWDVLWYRGRKAAHVSTARPTSGQPEVSLSEAVIWRPSTAGRLAWHEALRRLLLSPFHTFLLLSLFHTLLQLKKHVQICRTLRSIEDSERSMRDSRTVTQFQ